MKFSVIIPTYNDWNRLGLCLAALESQTFDKSQYEVIVINNAESENVPIDFHLPQSFKLVHEPQPGSYAARNTGVRTASGEILAFTDSDCIPDENWLVRADELFKRSGCDLIGGRIEIFQDDINNRFGYLYDRVTAFPQHKNVPEGKGVTANLFVKKSVFEATGGFNSTLKSGGDWEFTQRCIGMGYTIIYGEDILVSHPSRTLLTILNKQYRLTCGGALNTKKKYKHSYFRILSSHLAHTFKSLHRPQLTELNYREKMVIFFIDLLRYVHRTLIYVGLIFHLIDPDKARQ